MNQRPRIIKRIDPTHVRIVWEDELDVTLTAATLRGNCRCALCVDEMTGKRTFGPDQVPVDIRYTQVDLVGNYAIQMSFSDDHSTGIYTYRHLRELSESAGSAGADQGS